MTRRPTSTVTSGRPTATLPRSAGLLEACDDPSLLGFPLWPRQRAILEAVERGPRIHVWALGRRSGKTTMAALVGLHSCVFRPDLDALVRRGTRRHVIAVATRLEQARIFVQAARAIIDASPMLSGLVTEASADEIVFRNGAVLAAMPCTSRGVRGLAISTILMDEAAHFIDSLDARVAAETGLAAKTVKNLRSALSAEGLIRNRPEKNADGTVARWHVLRTSAPRGGRELDQPDPVARREPPENGLNKPDASQVPAHTLTGPRTPPEPPGPDSLGTGAGRGEDPDQTELERLERIAEEMGL